MVTLSFCIFFGLAILGQSYGAFPPSINDNQLVEPFRELHKLDDGEVQLSSKISTGSQLQSESNYTFFINYLEDGLGSCSYRSLTCNLRSAISMCAYIARMKSDHCDIYLPYKSIIALDSLPYPSLNIALSSMIASSFRLSIFGQSSTVECLPQGNYFCQYQFLSVSNLNENNGSLSFHMYNLTVSGFGSNDINGGALYLQGLNNTVINTVTFDYNTGYKGGALYMSNCSHSFIESCVFVNNNAYSHGGGLYMNDYNHNITISNNNIQYNNAGENGGGLYMNDANHDIIVSNNNIEYNNAYVNGGGFYYNGDNNAILISNTSIQYNNAGENGGGFYMNDANHDIIVSNSNIEYNTAIINGGGLYIAQLNYNILISNSKIQDNSAYYNGGGLFFAQLNYNILISNSKIQDNTAIINGGGFYVLYYSYNILISNSSIQYNKGYSNGGGFYINAFNHDITVSNSSIQHNKGFSTGGALYMNAYNHDIKLSNNNIQYNNAYSGRGGAFYCDKSNYAILISYNSIQHNYGYTGGGFYINSYNHDITISNNNIQYNIAQYAGGGFYYNGYNNAMLILNNSIQYNHAVQYGGGLYFNEKNKYFSILYNKIQYNNAHYGGGFYLVNLNHDLLISNNKILSNNGTIGGSFYLDTYNYNINITNNEVLSNYADYGGGFYINNHNHDITFLKNILNSNNAIRFYGGAIFISNFNQKLNFINNVWGNNTAKYFGGGVYIDYDNYNIHFYNESFLSNKAPFGGGLSIGSFNMDIKLEKSVFYMNEANTGGAIHIDRINKDISILSSTFSNNSATSGNGGAVLVNDYNSLINIDGSIFLGNRASITGGAVCILSFNSELSFWRSSFIGNSAQDGGGMFLSIQSYNIKLNAVIFDNNVADNNGGALFVSYKISAMDMQDVLMQNNRAGSSGGGLFIGIQNDHISCERCIYHRNIAQSDGGGVYISQYNNELSFIHCIVDQNSARLSGGGFHINIRNEHVRVSSVLFTSNIANIGNGGAIYVGEHNNLIVSSCNMTINVAITGSGSGLFSYKSNTLQILQSNFRSNVGSQLGTVTLSTDHSNCVIKGCIFVNNTATSGSAFTVVNGVDINLISCQFHSNFAYSVGGSICIENGNGVVLKNLQLRNNIAAGNGGGIYVTQSSSVTLHDSNLFGNRAITTSGHQGGGGGALYITTSSAISVKQCRFSNSTSGYGSAVFMTITTNVSLQQCSFINNKALAAGTVYWTTSDMIAPSGLNSSTSIVWVGNHAKYGSKYATDSDHFLSPAQVSIDRNTESSSRNSFLPAMTIIFYDYYDQIVQTENSDTITVTLVDWKGGCTPSPLKGAQTAVVVNGTAVFDSLSTSCTPEGRIYLQFVSTTHKSLSSVTVVYYPTFNPTSSPTSTPTTVPVVAQQLTVTSDNSVTGNDPFTIGISASSSLLLLLIIIAVIWRYILSPKAVQKRERMKRLDNLPLHQLLVDYTSSSNNDNKLLHLLESHPEYAQEKDYDNKTALDIIFEDENSLGVSSEVIYILLLSSCQVDENGEYSVDNNDVNVNGNFSWLGAVQRNDDATVAAVERILIKFKRNIHNLAHAVDSSGRSCKDIAGPRCKELILRKLYLYDRYEIKEGPPEHKSATSLVLIANDHGKILTNNHSDTSNSTTTSTITRVAMKFMCHRDQFHRETEARAAGDFDEKYVLPLLRVFDGDSSTKENIDFREDSVIYGLAEYPYCIVMEAATQDLKRFIDHEQIIDMNIEEIKPIMRQLTCCLDHIHKKNFVHGDIKPLNILQKGALLTLTDLDASCSIGNNVFAGSKTSTGYLPPEMFWCDPHSDDEVKVRTPIQSSDIRGDSNNTDNDEYDLVLAHPSQDMWALGCVFYQLCTGCTLFNISVDDNIFDQEERRMLFDWDLQTYGRKLLLVTDKYARNLISQLLSKDPNNRPSAERVLMHPFFTGKHCTRLQGEKAAWDIFLSYRVDSDSDHVEMLYHALTAKGLKVWWDKKCLLPGQPWEEGFCSGLVNSDTFVCLLSRGAINHSSKDWQNFEKLQRTSPCDNVLLEWRLALELRERGMIRGIYPVMIGDKDPVNGEYSNYFTSGCNPGAAPDITVDSVEAKLEEHLEREGLGSPYNKSDTVKSILKAILAHQGGFINGKMNTAIDMTITAIFAIAAGRNKLISSTSSMELRGKSINKTSEIDMMKIMNNTMKTEIDTMRLEIETLRQLISNDCNIVGQNRL